MGFHLNFNNQLLQAAWSLKDTKSVVTDPPYNRIGRVTWSTSSFTARFLTRGVFRGFIADGSAGQIIPSCGFIQA